MAKYTEVHEDLLSLFDKLIVDAGLDQVLNVKILADSRLKVIGKLKKSDDLLTFMTNEQVFIFINEEVFDSLTPDLQLIAAEEIIAGIGFNFETSAVSICKPDISTHSLLLKKYGFPEYERLFTSVKGFFAQKQEAEDQAKAEKAAKKAAKKRNK